MYKEEPLECNICDNIIVKYVAYGTLSKQHFDNTTVHSRSLAHSHKLKVARGVADTSEMLIPMINFILQRART